MKKIELKVTIEVPDGYVMDDPEWLLDDVVRGSYDYTVNKI